jgi:hypothetical protein
VAAGGAREINQDDADDERRFHAFTKGNKKS